MGSSKKNNNETFEQPLILTDVLELSYVAVVCTLHFSITVSLNGTVFWYR